LRAGTANLWVYASFASLKQFAERLNVERIDALICNAGLCLMTWAETEEIRKSHPISAEVPARRSAIRWLMSGTAAGSLERPIWATPLSLKARRPRPAGAGPEMPLE